MHRIGIISDTHGLLRPEVLEHLQGCEAILHGGDINKQKILDELKLIAPVYVVRGNNDKEWAKDLPETLLIELYGIRFFMAHNKKMLSKYTNGADIFIYGHSHKYEEIYKDKQLYLNPGSCGPRRFTQPITMAILEIGEDASFHVEKIEIEQQVSGAKKIEISDKKKETDNGLENKIPSDIKKIIVMVIKETDRGRSVEEIAGKCNINEDLAEQICRLYLTHPGVSAEGIMTKMGL